LHGEELHLLAHYLLHVPEEAVPHLGIHGGILDRGIGENESGRINELAGISRDIREEITVFVLVPRIKRRCRRSDDNSEQERRDHSQPSMEKNLHFGHLLEPLVLIRSSLSSTD